MSLAAFFMGLAGPVAKKVLTSLGIGVVSYVGVEAAFSAILGTAKGSYALIDPAVASLLALAGVPEALGIVSGALIASLSLIPLKKLDLL